MKRITLVLTAALAALVLATAASAANAPKPKLVPSECVVFVNAVRQAVATMNPSGTATVSVPLKVWNQLLAVAPKQIKPDVETIAAYWQKIAAFYATWGGPSSPAMKTAAGQAAFQQLVASLNQSKITQAMAAVSAWLQRNCRTG